MKIKQEIVSNKILTSSFFYKWKTVESEKLMERKDKTSHVNILGRTFQKEIASAKALKGKHEVLLKTVWKLLWL